MSQETVQQAPALTASQNSWRCVQTHDKEGWLALMADDVVIEDPIPAGTEGIDPGLTTSQQIGTRPGLEENDPVSRGWGWWWFSNIEFRDEKVVLNSTYLPAGTYEYVYTIRPGLEGTYNVMPPTGREFFFPDVFGRGAGSTFTVLPASE